ncbi:MAG: hypothetical protein EAZ23_23600 [Oscillatoriales cyanobacterium]|nr:MAG: hypothetical protein EAZ23_23600 [Oscillatoriales cyanobacterium]
MTGANLTQTDLQETKFYDANLSRANLSGAKMIETSFGDANLTDSDFRNAKFKDSVRFYRADLTRTTELDLDEIRANKSEMAIFTDAHFKDTIMPDGTIWNSVIPGVE